MAKGLKKECLDSVSQVIGRQLTAKEGEDIVLNIKSKVLDIRKTEPNLTKDQYVAKAAALVAQDMQRQANRMKVNAQRQVIALAAMQNYTGDMRAKGLSANAAAMRYLDKVHKHAVGVSKEYASELVDTLQAACPKFFGMIENDDAAAGILAEISGVDTKNADYKKAAQAWIQCAEKMRERYNRAGGDIRSREDWIMPQTHNQGKILNAARILDEKTPKSFAGRTAAKAKHAADRFKKRNPEANRDAWVDFVFERLDKTQYLDDNLQQMNDVEIKNVLREAYMSITENGDQHQNAADAKPSGRGKAKSEQRQEHRTIHFKDYKARIEYNRMFGQNPSIFGTMLSHVSAMSRDITLLEEMGPSPTTTFNTLRRSTEILNNQSNNVEGKKVTTAEFMLNAMWKNLNGSRGIQNETLAAIAQGARNLQVAGKLGGAFLTSMSDIATYFHMCHVNHMPFAQSAMYLVKSLNPADKSDVAFAAQAGVIGDVFNSAVNRFVTDNMSQGVTSKLADATMRASLLSQWTDGIRRGAAQTAMAFYTNARKYDWNTCDGWLRERLENFGLDETFWKVIQKAPAEKFDDAEFVTKNSILNISDADLATLGISRHALEKYASDYLAFVFDDAHMASLQPDLYTQAISNLGLARGTIAGEAWQCFFLFKSFPTAMLTRHFQRSGDLYRYKKRTAGKTMAAASLVDYYAPLLIGSTMIALVTNMFKDVLNGQDIQDPFTTDNIARAFTSGGGAGFAGDIFVSALGDYKYGHPNIYNAFGPVFSSMLDAYTIYDKYKDDRDIGANVLRFAKSNIPMVNLWYTKQLLNHAVFNQLQEMMNPGYHRRMERKSMRMRGTGYWWQPTSAMPGRLPRVAKSKDRWEIMK